MGRTILKVWAGFYLLMLLWPLTGHAARATCVTNGEASTGVLTMEAVTAGSAKYQVKMALVPGSSIFKLESANLLNNSDCYDPDSYADGILTLFNVKVGGKYFYARLSLVPDSNPIQFTIQSIKENPRLVPEAGIRISKASNPFATVAANGTAFLGYEDSASHSSKFQSSTDGLNFSNETLLTYSNRSVDSRRTLMPDGKTWRLYQYNSANKTMTSYVSTDGNNFTPESGLRYTPSSSDNNTIGVYDHYVAPDGSLIMIYVGDLYGKNNLRMARSTDNGLTFTFLKGNVLGDDEPGGGSNTFIDNKTIALPDGRRRMFAMRALELFSFITQDGVNWTCEPGVRVSYRDFAEAGLTLYSLNDPVAVYMPDGTCRIYVATATSPASSTTSSSDWAIVSAVWRE